MRLPHLLLGFVLAACAFASDGTGGTLRASAPGIAQVSGLVERIDPSPGYLDLLERSLVEQARIEDLIAGAAVAPVELPILDPWATRVQVPEGELVGYDAVTGEEFVSVQQPPLASIDPRVLQLDPQFGFQGDFRGASELPFAFSPLERVEDPGSQPYYRQHVKVYMELNGSRSQCSGTLIDSQHVLTAGHCVFDYERQSWRDSIYVVPALDANLAPFRSAGVIQMWAFRGWMDYGDFNHDVGLLRLDRSIGGVTGWKGLGGVPDLTGGPGFQVQPCFNVPHKDAGLEVPGYPAERPYSGRDMYTQIGTWDDCDDYTARYYGPAIRGQSGSGVINTDWIAYAIMTHGIPQPNGSVVGGHTIINASKFHQLHAKILEVTPVGFDLVPLMTNVSRQTYETGEALEGLSLYVHNLSTTGANSQLTVRLYLVDREVFQTTPLAEIDYLPFDYRGKGTYRLQIDNDVVLPHDLRTGAYELIVELVAAEDTNASNDWTLAPDTAEVTIAKRAKVGLAISYQGLGEGYVGTDYDTCIYDCVIYVDPSAQVTLEAGAGPGSLLLAWEGCAERTGTNCTVEMGAEDSEVKVWFVTDDGYQCSVASALARPFGDVDGDMAITSADALLALRAARGLGGLDETAAFNADLDGDGETTDSDAAMLVEIAAGSSDHSGHFLRPTSGASKGGLPVTEIVVDMGSTTCFVVLNTTGAPAPEVRASPDAASEFRILTLEHDQDRGTLFAVAGTEHEMGGPVEVELSVGGEPVGVLVLKER